MEYLKSACGAQAPSPARICFSDYARFHPLTLDDKPQVGLVVELCFPIPRDVGASDKPAFGLLG